MAYVPKKGPKNYNVEDDIKNLSKRGKKKTKAKPKKKENWVSRLKQKVKDYMSGANYAKEAKADAAKRRANRTAPKKKTAPAKTTKATKRTKKTSAQLRVAGLTEAEIKKMRGK
jgi:hypothetical protein